MPYKDIHHSRRFSNFSQKKQQVLNEDVMNIMSPQATSMRTYNFENTDTATPLQCETIQTSNYKRKEDFDG
jgi:hypothetical protein